jgi:GlpG protein
LNSSNSGQPSGSNWYPAVVVAITENLSELIKYLRKQGMAIHVTEEKGQQIVWVAQPQDVDSIKEILRRWQLGEISLSQSEVKADRQTQTWLNKSGSIVKQFPITFILLGLSILGALSTQFQNFLFIYYWFSFVDFLKPWQHQSIVDTIFQLQFWRLFTPMFLHFGIVHIVFNGLMLWVFGGRIETVVGKVHFVLMVLSLSVASNISQFVWEQNPQFGGMSGVNYGLLGYLWIRQLFAPHILLAMPKGMVTFFLAWLVLGVFGVIDYFIQGRIANGAHIGGLLAGALWGAIHGWYLSRQRQE